MLKDIQVLNQKETRAGFGEGIYEIGKANPNVIVLTADLAGSFKLGPFIKDLPNQFIEVGIAEANMIGIAAGLTIGGRIPYTTTFANFSTGRVYDQIRQSVAYSNKNVKICIYIFHRRNSCTIIYNNSLIKTFITITKIKFFISKKLFYII